VSRSPYSGLKRWHHWGGLVFGSITLTWIVSGWLYLNPGGSRSGSLETITTMSPYNVGGLRADNSSRPEHAAALTGGPLDPHLFTVQTGDAWARIPERPRPREIELTRVGGSPYFVFYADCGQWAVDSGQWAVGSGQWAVTSDSTLPIWELPTDYCRLPSGNCRRPTADCALPTAQRESRPP
jgi:hypothetical protein